MPMQLEPPRTRTIAEVITAMEALGLIIPPFTPEERELADRISHAYYFWSSGGQELPGRCPVDTSAELALFSGVSRVQANREKGRD
jgi:hypothetical protein